jgi:hypothetical protein
MRAIGIDPETRSCDACGLEGDRRFLDKSIPSADLEVDSDLADLGAEQEKLVALNAQQDCGQGAII